MRTDSEPRGGEGVPPRGKILIGSQREPRVAVPEPEESTAAAEIASTAATRGPEEHLQSTPPQQALPPQAFPPPRISRVSDDLQREIDEALLGLSMQDLMEEKGGRGARGPEPELDARYRGVVTKLHRDNVFISLPGNHEGVASLRLFTKDPQVGDIVEVTVLRQNPAEGLYELSVPGASVSVADWSDVEEGLVVEARITGHNSGGLECEVNNLRGFIPAGQVALYHVDGMEQFVGERWACVVTEANPLRRNLVLSRRAFLERERQESRQELLESLQAGQTREGVVRSLRDFGAFVDLGGVDGLIHISKLSWDRVNHPSEVLQEGQKVKVKIDKIDAATGKISLSYRDLIEQPWEQVDHKYPINAIVNGTISKIMEFGAFVRLEAGIEGLVHISELAHHRVSRVNSMVEVGQAVQVKVLSIDKDGQRMSLSIKGATQPKIEEAVTEVAEEEAMPSRSAVKKHQGPLKGGINRPTGGEQFGLKW